MDSAPGISRSLPQVKPLGPGSAHVWLANLTASPATVKTYRSLLSQDEIERADRFRFEHLQSRYVLGRGLLRRFISSYTSTPPEKLAFDYGPAGKPTLAGQPQIHFNISHSEVVALYAFSLNTELGVDIERVRPLSDLEKLAERYFHPGEIRELMALPPEERELGFFNCWSKKESVIKALGDGLQCPLDSFQVPLFAPTSTFRFTQPQKSEAVVHLYELAAPAGFAAALCTLGSEVEIIQSSIPLE